MGYQAAQAVLTGEVVHLAAPEAVGDGGAVGVILKPVVQPAGVVLAYHPAVRIVFIGRHRTSRIMVSHHAPGVLRIVFKPAHRDARPVIHGRQLAARAVLIARQRRRGNGRKAGGGEQMHGGQADAVVGATVRAG